MMSPEVVCVICFDPLTDRLNLPEFQTSNGDVIRKIDCCHPVCLHCLGRHIAVRVEEQRVFSIRCPAVSCNTFLFEQDIQRLVGFGMLDQEVLNKYVEIRGRDYATRVSEFDALLASTADEDYERIELLWGTTRMCPRCNVIIQRSEGCNSFSCICGQRFNYQGAARPVGNDVKHFMHIVKLAKKIKAPVRHALWFFKAHRTSDALHVSLEEALEMHEKAVNGDEQARFQIKKARQITAARQGGA